MNIWYFNYKDWIYTFATDVFTRSATPDVFSLSYGWYENDQCDIIGCDDSKSYVERCNVELMKLAALGKTVVVSSGDSGSTGRTFDDTEPYIRPAFPGSSPYVLSVGATALVATDTTLQQTSQTPLCTKYACAATSAASQIDTMFDDVGWCSGASFSILSDALAHQKPFLEEYVESGVALPSSFNMYGRGVVDVTIVGHNGAVYLDGTFQTIDGTSMSAPIWAGIVGLMNDKRLSENKPKVGMVAPLLYSMSNVKGLFHRDVKGNSVSSENGDHPIQNGQSDYGFMSGNQTRWDPIRGLGYPDVHVLLETI